ncbi:hypothetical protein L2E82_45973 [Cichorium intybus]|uniref:Uncharacterized protein n=1 Tax=Cichorium intybus TaxID=13427 RepID=A0ACB8ZVF0_CICIN|nr:hypothetical protein L2E82_45973 [Cichorium intybus]
MATVGGAEVMFSPIPSMCMPWFSFLKRGESSSVSAAVDATILLGVGRLPVDATILLGVGREDSDDSVVTGGGPKVIGKYRKQPENYDFFI